MLTAHNPPLVGLLGARLARRYGIRFTYFLPDIHPDILAATGQMRYLRPLFPLWEFLHRRILSQADAVIVLGEGMKRTLVDRKGVSADRVHIIPVWGRPELEPTHKSNSMRAELGIAEDELLVLYAGNMGIMHPLDPIVDAAVLLDGKPVRFVFVGDGARRRSLVTRVRHEKLGRVSFLPFQTESRFAQLVAASDICIVVLQPGMESFALPSRTFTFMSAAKPIISMMSSSADVAVQITESNSGWNVTSGDELARLLLSLADAPRELAYRGRLARELYLRSFRKELVIAEYAKVIEGRPIK